jgi:hypothetical protein
MARRNRRDSQANSSDFARQAEERSAGLIGEFWALMRYHRKWWLLPIIAMLLLVGIVAVLGGSAIAPFIYTLF